MKNLYSMGVLIFFLSGCASVPMATLEQDKKAKDFSILPDKGSVFIFRNETSGGAWAFLVSMNGKTLGQTAPHTFFRLILIPGKYRIDSYSSSNNSTIDLNVEAGKNYFVWQEMTMGSGFGNGIKLQQVNEAEGRKGVLESKLIAASITDDDLNMAVNNTENAPSVSQKLRDLQSLRKDGVITEDEYEYKKKELLKSF